MAPFRIRVYREVPDIGSAVRCPRHLFLHLPHGGVEVEGSGVVRQPIGVQVSREVVLIFQPVVVERACSQRRRQNRHEVLDDLPVFRRTVKHTGEGENHPSRVRGKSKFFPSLNTCH